MQTTTDSETTAAEAINGRYVLHHKIGEGGMGLVHYATDRLTQTDVALKQIKVKLESLEWLSDLSMSHGRSLEIVLAKEFQMLASLRHPHVISVSDYGFDSNNDPFYTMDYIADAETILDAGKQSSYHGKIKLIQQFLQALIYLHRRGILHRDLKPNNVLVDKEHVRVVDFGLSSFKGEEGGTGGTVLYMSPEILSREGQYVEATDLYSVGVMIYEMFAGEHPFYTKSSDFANLVMHQPPDLSKLQVNDELAEVIGTLLAKQPQDRYQRASDCFVALNQAIGQPVVEEIAIRESFFQAAAFVGREAELTQLRERLAAAKNGKGSAWLLAGESGVGKSRLLRELQTEALVQGFQLLKAQGAPTREGGYQFWREPLRQLLVTLDEVDDLSASVLLPVVPDIASLLGRTVEAAPELGVEASSRRFYRTIAKLFKLSSRPLLLILDDLHWATESLQPIPELLRTIDSQPLMIIGSYRNDERPTLSSELPKMQLLSLGRLSAADMSLLMEAILGRTGKSDKLLTFLKKETEGNAFFAIEILRTLAEEAGRLQQIGTMLLPEHIFPEGIRNIVQRRIDRIPPDYQPLLQLSAIAGRQIDLKVLAHLAQQDRNTVENWLAMCANAAILEVYDNQWQFSHDKIRERLVASLSLAKQKEVHSFIANALEQLYGEAPEYYAKIALHWRHAENLEQEYRFTILAGDYVQSQNLRHDAIAFYERAYAIMAPVVTVHDQQDTVDLINKLSSCYVVTDIESSYRWAEKAYDLAQDTNYFDIPYLKGTAESLFNLSNVSLSNGQNQQALQQLKEAHIHFTRLGDLKKTALALDRISNAFLNLGQLEESKSAAQEMLALSEQLDDITLLLNCYRTLAMVYDGLQQPDEEMYYEQQAIELARQVGDRESLASILINHGVTLHRRNRFEEAVAITHEGLALAIETNYQFKVVVANFNLSCYFLANDVYDASWLHVNQSLAAIGENEYLPYRALNYENAAQLSLIENKLEQALGYAKKAEELLQLIDSKRTKSCIFKGLIDVYQAADEMDNVVLYKARLDELENDPENDG